MRVPVLQAGLSHLHAEVTLGLVGLAMVHEGVILEQLIAPNRCLQPVAVGKVLFLRSHPIARCKSQKQHHSGLRCQQPTNVRPILLCLDWRSKAAAGRKLLPF